MTNFIWITTRKEMFHNYPDAPNEVSFLRNEHRHIFHFKVYIEIFTNDRDVEFIMFKRDVESILSNINDLKWRSCEIVSNYLAIQIRSKYQKRHIKIETSEDGENGVLMDFPVK